MSSTLKSRKDTTESKSTKNTVEANGKDDASRVEMVLQEIAGRAPPQIQPYIEKAVPFIARAWIMFEVALPHIIKFAQLAQDFLSKLPDKVIFAFLGFAVCFFGGVFPATIAAFEAWNLCGGQEALRACKELYEEFLKFQEANEDDDKKDDNDDGVADVKQIDSKQLIARKTLLALKATDPNKVNGAIVCIYTGFMGVIATLKIQFARTITLGEVIGEKLYLVATRVEEPFKNMLPEDYKKWTPILTKWACKAVAISVAWWIQRVISAVHSAIRGGHLFSKYLVALLEEKNIAVLSSYGSMAGSILAWGVAFMGLTFQFMFGFGVPFPLNLLTWPLSILEYFIIWCVSSSSAPQF